MRRDAARDEGEIGLLGLAIGAAPAIRGLFHPYFVGETPRGITVARTTVCVTRMCVSHRHRRCRRPHRHPRFSTYSIPLSRRVRSPTRARAHTRDSAKGVCGFADGCMRVFSACTCIHTCACAHACGRAGLPRQRVLAGEMPLIGISLVEMDPLAST